MLAGPARGTQGLRPEDISELVRDLVARHASTGATTSAPAEAGAPAMGAAVREASVQAEGSAHQHSAEGGGAPAQARDGAYGGPRSHIGQSGGTGYAPPDYNLLREPLFAPHGGLHPGLAHVARPVHTGRLGHYGPSQYLDRQMLEEYSHKMQMLQHDFDVMLRPKLDSLRRQIVTVEERIREVSLMKDELLEEALLDHRALVEQITLSSDRRLGALTLDLEQLMRDVALIHDLIQQLAPAQQGPQTPTAVWALLSRYDELSNACHQLAQKRFKTTVEESAGDLRQEVGSMRKAAPHLAPLPKGSRHVRDGSVSPSKRAVGASDGAEPAPGSQGEEMRALLQVKDQMVWMMLEERSKLQEKNKTLEAHNEALQQQLTAKGHELEAIAVAPLPTPIWACAPAHHTAPA